MKDVIDNNTDAIKSFLTEYGLKGIVTVKHIGNFVFEAITHSNSIKIITEPFDEEEKYIKILSITII